MISTGTLGNTFATMRSMPIRISPITLPNPRSARRHPAPEPVWGNAGWSNSQKQAVLFCRVSRGPVYHLQSGTGTGGVVGVSTIRGLDLSQFHFQPVVFQL